MSKTHKHPVKYLGGYSINGGEKKGDGFEFTSMGKSKVFMRNICLDQMKIGDKGYWWLCSTTEKDFSVEGNGMPKVKASGLLNRTK